MHRYVCPNNCSTVVETLGSTVDHMCKVKRTRGGQPARVTMVRVSAVVDAPVYVERLSQSDLDFLASVDCKDNLANTYEVLDASLPVSVRVGAS